MGLSSADLGRGVGLATHQVKGAAKPLASYGESGFFMPVLRGHGFLLAGRVGVLRGCRNL